MRFSKRLHEIVAYFAVTAPFSGVTSTEAFKVLEELGFTLVDGHAAEPLEDLPKGQSPLTS